MQPLKRYTQCGSLTMLFAVFIVLFGVSSTALTTFGKSNPNNIPQPPTPPPIKGRECNNQADCASLQNTSCVRDPGDGRLRCLCGDNHPPMNGLCNAKYKALRHSCMETSQCDEGMLCSAENNATTRMAQTTTALGSRNANNSPTTAATPPMKICICDEEGGFVENVRGNECNGALSTVSGGGLLLPIMSLMIAIWSCRRHADDIY